MNFCRNQNQASINQQVYHNGNHVPNLLRGSAVESHFSSTGRRSNISSNRNNSQENPRYTNTLTENIKQHNPSSTIIIGKRNCWPTTLLAESASAATITNTELFKQVNIELQLSSTKIKLVEPHNVDMEVIGKTC